MKLVSLSFIFVVFTSLLNGVVSAKGFKSHAGPVQAEVVKITDADTIRVIAYPWPSMRVAAAVRIRGIDTPEKRRSKCNQEKALAYRATAYVKGLLKPGHRVKLENIRFGKYAGRVVADLFFEMPKGWENLASVLFAAGYAKEYHGGKKRSWCN